MKRSVVLAGGILFFASILPAQESGLGLGVILGEPTGLSGKLWVSEIMAFDLAASWSFVGEGSFYLHGDYLLHVHHLIPMDEEYGSFTFHYGIGPRVELKDDPRVGIRFPFGLSYYFARIPLELFLEVAPVLDLLPATTFAANAGLGIRYYFPLSPRSP